MQCSIYECAVSFRISVVCAQKIFVDCWIEIVSLLPGSAMYFLTSVVLLKSKHLDLYKYIQHITSSTVNGPPYSLCLHYTVVEWLANDGSWLVFAQSAS